MKRLKWFIALFALLVTPLALEVTPASADWRCAGSAQICMSTTYWNGVLNYDIYFEFAGATEVQIANDYTSGGVRYRAGWYDQSIPAYEYSQNPVSVYTFLNPPGPSTVTITHGAWCGGAVHVVQTMAHYRVKFGGSYGPWHSLYTNGYAINC